MLRLDSRSEWNGNTNVRRHSDSERWEIILF